MMKKKFSDPNSCLDPSFSLVLRSYCCPALRLEYHIHSLIPTSDNFIVRVGRLA